MQGFLPTRWPAGWSRTLPGTPRGRHPRVPVRGPAAAPGGGSARVPIRSSACGHAASLPPGNTYALYLIYDLSAVQQTLDFIHGILWIGGSQEGVPQLVDPQKDLFEVGGVVVNFNPLYTERELEHQVTDSGVSIMIALSMLMMRWAELMEAVPRAPVTVAIPGSFCCIGLR